VNARDITLRDLPLCDDPDLRASLEWLKARQPARPRARTLHRRRYLAEWRRRNNASRMYALRRALLGLCRSCPAPATHGSYCQRCCIASSRRSTASIARRRALRRIGGLDQLFASGPAPEPTEPTNDVAALAP
jgi:hypothetical protein